MEVGQIRAFKARLEEYLAVDVNGHVSDLAHKSVESMAIATPLISQSLQGCRVVCG